MNGAVAERRRKRGIHLAVLVQEGETVELGACNRYLEVIAGPRPVLDRERGSIWERLLEKRTNRLGLHRRSW